MYTSVVMEGGFCGSHGGSDVAASLLGNVVFMRTIEEDESNGGKKERCDLWMVTMVNHHVAFVEKGL